MFILRYFKCYTPFLYGEQGILISAISSFLIVGCLCGFQPFLFCQEVYISSACFTHSGDGCFFCSPLIFEPEFLLNTPGFFISFIITAPDAGKIQIFKSMAQYLA